MEEISLYIHYPFCNSKCPYCDFNSFANLNVDKDILLNSYLKEINSYHKLLPNRKIKTIFFGGGTPSLMSANFLGKILNEIHKLWNVDKDVEISLEANPTSVEIGKFQDFKNLGINRLSIGIQALNDKDLKFLGRKHSAKEGLNAIKIAQKIFQERYSIDLIYARPNQSLKEWKSELNDAIKLSPNHISLYELTIENGTPFYAQKISELNEDVATDLYFSTNEIMDKNDIPFYEISNYARKGYECKHNINYWKSGEWIGIGAGAHSRICFNQTENNYKTRTVIENIKNPNLWMKKVQENDFGYKEKYDLPEQDFVKEFFLMGLRLRSGISNKDLQKYTLDKTIFDFVNLKNCELLEKQNFIEVSKKSIRVKNKGLILLNRIIENIIL